MCFEEMDHWFVVLYVFFIILLFGKIPFKRKTYEMDTPDEMGRTYYVERLEDYIRSHSGGTDWMRGKKVAILGEWGKANPSC